MKKFLLSLMMVLSMIFATSCSEYDAGAEVLVKELYNNAFKEAFDVETINPNHTWGFYIPGNEKTTRAVVPEINDPFVDYGNTDNLYASKLPSNAIEIQDIWNYQNKYGCGILKSGKYEIGCWNTAKDAYLDLYITGDVELKSNTIHSANIYLLPGSRLTYTGSAIHNVKFYVSENATLDYTLSSLSSQGWSYDAGNNNWVNGVTEAQIFNRGTVNLPENFELNQDAVFFNEGTVNGVDITSKPGDGHPSYFYNYGTLNLEGKFELNSCSNFYNEGTVIVEGDTDFTQAGTWWINKGHYTTDNINFSAQNGRVYNYCNLIVEDKLHMFDGEFNLMQGSYVEANTAEFDNFVVNMYGESGMNINNGVTFPVGQGDGTYQGFKAVGNKAWIRFGGNTTVAAHKLTFELSGPITYAIEKIVDEGANNSGVQPTYRFNSDTIESPFASLNPTHNDDDCGAVWEDKPQDPDPDDDDDYGKYGPCRIICEDLVTGIYAGELSSIEHISSSDWDYNDLIFDAQITGDEIIINILNLGGTLPIYIEGYDKELHVACDGETGKMMVYDPIKQPDGTYTSELNKEIRFKRPSNVQYVHQIRVYVTRNGYNIDLPADEGQAPAKICVKKTFRWCDERQSIKHRQDLKFSQWIEEGDGHEKGWNKDWWYNTYFEK